ncbi:hypothetical protein H8958_005718, partial [Nasalis larvatus]
MAGEELLPKNASGEIILETVDLCDTWEALEKCKDAGLTKSIGVSNFNHKLLELILNKPGLKYKPTCNQGKFMNEKEQAGKSTGEGWIPTPISLGGASLKIHAKKHSCRPGQVALRYQLQRGVVVLAKSFSQKRIKENFQIFDFELTPEDMKAIDGLNRNLRYDKLQ